MSENIRYPNITGLSEKEQLSQIKSYLHQLVDQLNYALPTIGSADGTSQAPSTYEVQGVDMSYYELRSLIIQEIQDVERLFDKLSQKIQSEYVREDELSDVVEEALTKAKESGEFDGKDGYTPVKGKDYFTEDEINSVAAKAAGKITFTLDEEGNLYYELEE